MIKSELKEYRHSATGTDGENLYLPLIQKTHSRNDVLTATISTTEDSNDLDITVDWDALKPRVQAMLCSYGRHDIVMIDGDVIPYTATFSTPELGLIACFIINGNNDADGYMCEKSTINIVSDITVYYLPESQDKFSELLEAVNSSLVEKRNKPVFSMITVKNGQMSTSSFEVSVPVVHDLDMMYKENFAQKTHKKIISLIDEEKPGLILLNGAPGTGKTNYIRYLMSETSKIKPYHSFVYILPRMLEMISGTELVDFMQNHFSGATVIVEDGEQALLDRRSEPSGSGLVSAVLNMTDGLLSDVYKIRFICTINCDMADLDPAILRAGRLIHSHTFEKLTVAEAERVAASYGIDRKFDKEVTLSEIFKESDFAEPVEKRKIGFGAK